ncbi:ABC transporter ATP-binding protein [Leptolyngbya sp. GGD]|uniref:ABC transporter ATP-binding protein n=1 Tax=Leptolyngbya sp. GGD TaxID=2997907 RepID=UPI00227B57FE|nr:ABC transporter ATP-binding protein [Leptolyngbya sp. GGD]MCY6489300.1 ABC transporter ATP-binding protein [Leptolyngbya sp. GGD]
MSHPIIRVENLGKKYTLSHQEKASTFRDALTQRLSNPFRRSASKPNGGQLEEFWALKDVSFEVQQGDRVGIIGRNGAGKSTLLKILSRITAPTHGEIRIKGRVASLLEVGTGFHPELTGRENIFLNGAILGMSKAEINRKFDEIVAFAEVERFIDTPVKRYSSGMYVRLAFAVAAHLEPEVLIVDEVLAVGDSTFQQKCLGKMEDVSKNSGRTVVFVSHNMATVEKLCNKGIFLKHGNLIETASITQAIQYYMGQIESNVAIFKDSPVRRATADQVGKVIEITAEYELDREITLPSLGFVISDYLGNPILGCNPVVSPPTQPTTPSKSGIVKASIQSPKLLNGTYRISLWFGDGRKDFFHQQDCLTLEVINMADVNQLPSALVGPVFPTCQWSFSS